MPQGLLRKCNKCGQPVYVEDVKNNYYICPKCDGYFRVHAYRRIEMVIDDGTFEEWYPIYDKAVAAGKGLWVKVYSGSVDEWLERLDKLVARYGSSALFLYFSPMSRENADRILEHAERYWSDVKGSFHGR